MRTLYALVLKGDLLSLPCMNMLVGEKIEVGSWTKLWAIEYTNPFMATQMGFVQFFFGMDIMGDACKENPDSFFLFWLFGVKENTRVNGLEWLQNLS